MFLDPNAIPSQKDHDVLIRLISDVSTGNDSKKLKNARLELLLEELAIVKAALELVQWISAISTGADCLTEPKKVLLDHQFEELARLTAELGTVRKKQL